MSGVRKKKEEEEKCGNFLYILQRFPLVPRQSTQCLFFRLRNKRYMQILISNKIHRLLLLGRLDSNDKLHTENKILNRHNRG